MKRFLAILLLLPSIASAEIFVLHCANSSGTSCPSATWVLPRDAVTVQVLRGTTSPFVAFSTVLSTERIAACYHDPAITAGSTRPCATRVPGRNDVWQLKSILYLATERSLQITVTAATPRWDSGELVSSNVLPNLYIRLYGALEGQALMLLDAVPWAASVRFRRASESSARWCFAASLALDTTGDQLPDEESPQGPQWCGTHEGPRARLIAPESISGEAPAP